MSLLVISFSENIDYDHVNLLLLFYFIFIYMPDSSTIPLLIIFAMGKFTIVSGVTNNLPVYL